MEILLLGGLGALLIFMMINSRKRQRAQQEKLSSGLAPGASVMTTFGLYGTVVDIDAESNKVTIESAPGTVLTVHRQAIGTVEQPEAADDAEAVLPADAEVPDDLSSLEVTDAEKLEDEKLEDAQTEPEDTQLPAETQEGDISDTENGSSDEGREDGPARS